MNKKTVAPVLGLVLAAFGSASLSASTIMVGSGSSVSYVLFESPNVGVRQYAVSYDFNPVVAIGTADLLRVIDQEDPSIMITIVDFGTMVQPNEFVDAVTFNGITETFDGTNFWTQAVAGGQDGAADLGVPDPQPVPFNAYQFGSGSSAPFRIIEPGSNDAFVFGDFILPSIAPVPEPSSLIVCGSALMILCFARRRE